jgi:hypothetical protein
MHDAGVSGQVHAVYESTARLSAFFERRDDIWTGDSCVEKVHPVLAQQGTVVENPIKRLNGWSAGNVGIGKASNTLSAIP